MDLLSVIDIKPMNDTDYNIFMKGHFIQSLPESTMQDAIEYVCNNIIPRILDENDVYGHIYSQILGIVDEDSEFIEFEHIPEFTIPDIEINDESIYEFMTKQPLGDMCIFCYDKNPIESIDDVVKNSCKNCAISSHTYCLIRWGKLQCVHCKCNDIRKRI